MAEYIIKLDKALYDPDTGAAVFKPEFCGELIRCRECVRFREEGVCSFSGIAGIRPEDYCFMAKRGDK